jgi:hypothetical protein
LVNTVPDMTTNGAGKTVLEFFQNYISSIIFQFHGNIQTTSATRTRKPPTPKPQPSAQAVGEGNGDFVDLSFTETLELIKQTVQE